MNWSSIDQYLWLYKKNVFYLAEICIFDTVKHHGACYPMSEYDIECKCPRPVSDIETHIPLRPRSLSRHQLQE